MPASIGSDQAHLPSFRLLVGVQALATLVFGVVPLIVPSVSASISGYSGDDAVVYRLAGAATTGYLGAAVAALMWRTCWADLRIGMVATLTFTALAAIASLVSLVGGDQHWAVFVVLVAATVFVVIAAYWLRRDEGPATPAGVALTLPVKVVVGLATLSAGVFGLMPLVAVGPFAQLFNLKGTDVWIFRMAGAACFGYATAGILSLRSAGFERFRVQNLAAITFNGTAAVAAWATLIQGQGGWLAPIVALAASFFAVALSAVALRSPRP